MPVLTAMLLASCGGSTAAPAASISPAAPSGAVSPPVAASRSASASAPAAAKTTTSIRFGILPSIATLPPFVASDTGELGAVGVSLNFETVTDTPKALVAVASGQLDMASISLSAAALNAFNRGTDLKLIASGGVEAQGHAAFIPVIARTDLYDSGAIKTLAQLKGHKVALNSKGTVSEYDLALALAKGGLKVSDVDVVLLPWPDMIPALGNKSIDVGLIGQPLATQALEKGVGKIVNDDYAPGTQNGVLVANSKFMSQHAEAMTSFLAVYVKVIRRLNDGKVKSDQAALASIQKWVKTPPDIVKKAPDPYWPPNAKLNRQGIVDEQTYYLQNKEVDYTTPIEVNRLIDESYLDAALKRIGG